MKPTKNHLQTFVYEAIPILFHGQTKDFLEYLEKDGLDFLLFWWNKTGEKFDEAERMPSEGLAFELRSNENGANIILLTLPKQASPEVYYMALFQPKQKRTFFKWENYPRVISVERDPKSMLSPVSTTLSELTPRGKRIHIGEGPNPDLEAFYQAVIELLIKK